MVGQTEENLPPSTVPTPANLRFAAHILLGEAGRLRGLSERRRRVSGEDSSLAAEYASDADSLRLVAAHLVREVGDA